MARPPSQEPAAPPGVSGEPLPETLTSLLERRGLTPTGLHTLLKAEGIEISRSRLHQLVTGQGALPSPDQMERIASVLRVSPGHFAEYRLWRVRAMLDPGVVGFHRAMSNLEHFTGRRATPGPLPRPEPSSGDGVAPADARYPAPTRRAAKGRG